MVGVIDLLGRTPGTGMKRSGRKHGTRYQMRRPLSMQYEEGGGSEVTHYFLMARIKTSLTK